MPLSISLRRHPKWLLFLLAEHFLIIVICALVLHSRCRPAYDQTVSEENCVCGEKAETLRKWAGIKLYFDSRQNASKVNQSSVAIDDIEQFRSYIYPPNGVPIANYKAMQLQGKILEWPKHKLSDEYPTQVKKEMFMAVMTSEEYLPTRAKTLYETWGKNVESLFFYVGEDCNVPNHLSHLPIVKLKGVSDREYPPLRKAFAVIQHMYDHHLEDYSWFVRADDDMYVRTTKLTNLLRKLNPYERVYLGRGGTGRKEHGRMLRMLPHERFCMGGPGIFFSAGAMIAIGPHLKNCLNAVLYHNNHSRWNWDYDDVEIGRCLSRKINIQCSTSRETRLYFKYDYLKDSLQPQSLWNTPSLRKLITLHPVKQRDNMHSVHHFYETIEFQEKKKELNSLAEYLNQLCTSLPTNLLPPDAKSVCHLKLA